MRANGHTIGRARIPNIPNILQSWFQAVLENLSDDQNDEAPGERAHSDKIFRLYVIIFFVVLVIFIITGIYFML